MTTPRATYRVQLHPGFGFDDVAAVAPYLAALGITHVYCSPYLQAAPGSTHGYDVVNHRRLNEELGGAGGFRRMGDALAAHGLSHIVDIVPNHMSTRPARRNRWWWDVLARGPASRWAHYFDIDWGAGGVLLPVLGDHYGRVLDRGEVRVEPDGQGAGYVVRYHEHEAPIAPGSFDGDLSVNDDPDRLDALLLRQNYRLAYWRVAGEELDYRRFFDIPELIALDMDEPEVFDDVHGLVLELVAEGSVDGLRVDHPDGLRAPAWYLDRLRAQAGPEAYLVVEKILHPGEALPQDWPVDGTTGYDFLNAVLGLFVDPAGEEALTELYHRFTAEGVRATPAGIEGDFEAVAYEARHEVMRQSLAADLRRLTDIALEVCRQHRHHRDWTRREVREVLAEVAACFPVYRTYVQPGRPASEADRTALDAAARRARRRLPEASTGLVDFLHGVLLGEVAGGPEADLALRFQQFTAPVMAKGVEDTAFYRYFRLIALNEVGGDPGRFGTGVGDFHGHNARMAERWPATMLSTSTHDTKRSEDVRTRLALLSEIPEQWALAVRRWDARHQAPDPNTAYLLYQTLVGAWPIGPDRAVAYMMKAVKEAKQRTSWVNPDPAYEHAVAGFVTAVLGDDELVADLEAFVRPLVEAGRVTSLAQTLLKLTSPGVPDIYQGSELWDLSLVDPDNRRPVDYDRRRQLLDKVAGATAADVLAWGDDGAPKLWLIRRTLEAPIPAGADYRPLTAEGEKAAHVVAYARGAQAVVVVPRLVIGLGGDWAATALRLPPGRWTDRFTGASWDGAVGLADLLGRFPVALLGPSP